MLRLSQLRKEKGINQEQFAKDFGVVQNTISRWETGERLVDSETLIKIADYFGVSVDYLMGKTEVRNINNLDIAEELEDELFEKRKLLFDISKKATKEDLDQIIKIVETFVDE